MAKSALVNDVQLKILITTAKAWKENVKKQEQRVFDARKVYDDEEKKLESLRETYRELIEGIEPQILGELL